MVGLYKVHKKYWTTDAWQDSEYSSGSEYGKVLNIPWLHKILNKTLHPLYTFDRVLDMPAGS